MRMLHCLCVALLATSAFARPVDLSTTLSIDTPILTAEFALTDLVGAFDIWLQVNEREYKDDANEKSRRREIFGSNAAFIASQNANPASTFELALNEFADLTYEEFSVRLGVKGAEAHRSDNAATPFMYADVKDVPASVDWREEGVVTDVKNQGACGSCWAFSTTGSIEGVNALKTGKLVSLSEQQLVSCDRNKDMGCSGGLMDYAFDYVEKNGGIDSEDDYGYWSFDMPCQHRKAEDRTVVTIDGHEDVPVNDSEALKKAVAHQPVSVAICATPSMQFYRNGIIKEDSCCTSLNHGVLAVGYVDSDNEKYWIVKNSWGSGWGEDGFFKLSMESKNPEGVCGVHKAASYPIKKTDYNPEVPTFCGYFGLTECPVDSSCACRWNFFDLLCLSWGCQSE